MLRYSPYLAALSLRRFQLRTATARTTAAAAAMSLRHNTTTTSSSSSGGGDATATTPEGTKAPGAKVYKSREGWRVYKSVHPTIIGELGEHDSLYQFMSGCWARAPDRTALIEEETKEQLSFKQLQGATEHFAQVLYHKANVRRGDVVCLMTLNTIYYPVVAFGTMRLGAVLTTSSAMTTVDALCHQLEASKTEVIVTTHAFLNTAKTAAAKVVMRTGNPIRVLLLEQLLKTEAPAIPSSYTAMQEAEPDDVVFLPFSSGTTGIPKGTMLTNRNITASILTMPHSFPMYPDTDVVINVLPCFHIYGFSTVLCGALSNNVPQVIMSKYNADSYLKAVQDYMVTIAFIAPPIAASLLHRLEDPNNTYDFSSMKDIVCAAAPVSPDIIRRLVLKSPGLHMGQGWGMTEMSPTVTYCDRHQTDIPAASVGMLAASNEMRIVKVDDSQQSGADKSAGIDVEEGKEGELWLRGPQMMKGYLKAEDTAKCMQDGWYRTGDIGYVDDRKLLYISGRLKELIKYKGFQVSPPEIESELIKHPWVKDCIVLGVPDQQDISFENPRALVVLVDNLPKEDAVRASDEIYRYMMHKMPPHKRLHGGVRIVDSIMKSATGKLMRRQQRTAELQYLRDEEY
uniref:4-coumarate--CoA ligase n=1 Tax=Strigomonas galati TaxID=1003336 RepID=T1YSW1_9TRYP|nr:4-coumarate--CoA ligase [Strigomonas galati]